MKSEELKIFVTFDYKSRHRHALTGIIWEPSDYY